jgi:hypothetical protein
MLVLDWQRICKLPIKDHKLYSHLCVLFQLPHEALHLIRRKLPISLFMTPLIFSQATTILEDI